MHGDWFHTVPESLCLRKSTVSSDPRLNYNNQKEHFEALEEAHGLQ